jgi:hypothetical protein
VQQLCTPPSRSQGRAGMATGVQAQEGTTCHRSLPPPLPSQVTWRSVPLDLVSHCFNYLRADPVTAVCPNGARCLRCHRRGTTPGSASVRVVRLSRSTSQAAEVILYNRHAKPQERQCGAAHANPHPASTSLTSAAEVAGLRTHL